MTQSPISWRTAMRLAELHDEAKSSEHDMLVQLLGNDLSEIQVSDMKKGLPFYNSKQRVRASLADCNSAELQRVIEVAKSMLEGIEAAESAEARFARVQLFLHNKYREDDLGCDTFQEFVDLIRG